MNDAWKRPPALLASLVAVFWLAGAVLVTLWLDTQRERDTRAYLEARYRQRKSLGMSDANARARPPGPKPAAVDHYCVTGADNFATAIQRRLFPALADEPARTAIIERISRYAVRAEWDMERLYPAPTLPKRLGSKRDETGVSRPITPPMDRCSVGDGVAEFSDYRERSRIERAR